MPAILRSLLFVPGTRPDRFPSAMASGADAVVLDLEDSVDAHRKADARLAIADFCSGRDRTAVQVFVRINSFSSAWFHDDVEAIRRLETIAGIVLPKAETADQVIAVAEALQSGHVVPLIETARGVLNAGAIVSSIGAIPALLFGAEDLTAQIGIPRTVDGDELVFARSQIVLAATSVGADAIDAVFIDIGATDDLRRDAQRARALGFRGKMAIHPSQIPIIHEVFSPSAAELAHARRIVDAFDAAQAQGEAVIRLDNRMVDMPVVVRARRLLS